MTHVPNNKLNYTLMGALLAVGLALGLGGFTFQYAEGTSYLSDNPEACINCHVMEEQYAGWQRASHGRVAVCNDCHVPHDFVGKWLTKAENGWHHSVAFTSDNFPTNIIIRPESEAVVLENCLYCHQELVSPVLAMRHPEDANCLQCHRSVGHGN